jgi:protein SCO1/2
MRVHNHVYLCSMSRKRIFYIVFFVVLVVGFYVGLTYAVPAFVHRKPTPLSTIEPFAFTNQDGKTITEKDIKGKVIAVNFFFTTCTSVCPRMNNNLKPIYEAFKSEPGFLILSHTSDPERDSAARLKRYSDSLKVDTNKWMFLTGRKDSLYSMARHSYSIDNPNNFVKHTEDEFLHTQFIALVNKQGEVVQVYDGLKPSEITEMQIEIKKLLKE